MGNALRYLFNFLLFSVSMVGVSIAQIDLGKQQDEKALSVANEQKCTQLLGLDNATSVAPYVRQVTLQYDAAILEPKLLERYVSETELVQKKIGVEPNFTCRDTNCSVTWHNVLVDIPEVRLKAVQETIAERSSVTLDTTLIRINPDQLKAIASAKQDEISACAAHFNRAASLETITRIENINSEIRESIETPQEPDVAPFLLELNESLKSTVRADANTIIEVGE